MARMNDAQQRWMNPAAEMMAALVAHDHSTSRGQILSRRGCGDA